MRRRYDFENKDSDNSDISASNLVGWNGLIISVLLAGGGLLISKDNEVKLNMFEWSLLSGTLICLGTSLLLSLIVYRRASYYVVPEAERLMRLFQQQPDIHFILTNLIATMNYAIVENAKRNDRRTNFISTAQILFFVAMIMAITFLIEQGYKLVSI